MSKAKTVLEAMGKHDLIDLMPPNMVWVATIVNRFKDIEVFVGLSYESMNRTVADYCRTMWVEVAREGEPVPEEDADLIDAYFERSSEKWTYGEYEVK